jgi:hypothetical protein
MKLSTTRCAIFGGPSLFGLPLPTDIDLLEPVQCGDVMRAVETGGYTALLIIDGYYEQVPAIWHKEILWALSKGIHVWGAASLGALRAAELAPFGMVGVGEIFHMYVNGVLDGDDEVCLLHRPQNSRFEPLSEALVNVRPTVRRAIDEHVLNATEAELIITTARACFYADRTWDQILCDIDLGTTNASFASWLEDGHVDQKKLDAELAIQKFTAARTTLFHELFRPTFDFRSTRYLERCFDYERSRSTIAED